MLRRFFQLPIFIWLFKKLKIYAACNEDYIDRLMTEFEFKSVNELREHLLKNKAKKPTE